MKTISYHNIKRLKNSRMTLNFKNKFSKEDEFLFLMIAHDLKNYIGTIQSVLQLVSHSDNEFRKCPEMKELNELCIDSLEKFYEILSFLKKYE